MLKDRVFGLYAVKTRSSWRKALMSSPPNPIFSLGMSRGPSPIAPGRAGLGLPGPVGGPVEEIGARDALAMRVPMLGTVPGGPAGSAGLGGVPMGPSCCFSMCGLCAMPLGCGAPGA